MGSNVKHKFLVGSELIFIINTRETEDRAEKS